MTASRLATAALIYGIALAGAVALGCAAPGFSCHLGPDSSLASSAAMVTLVFLATGSVLMGGVLAPAALLLRRMRWLYWWSVLSVAAATAVLPLAVVCGLETGNCGSRGFVPMSGSLIFASLCGGLFLWWSWLRPQASPPITERLAAQSPAVKLGLIFVGGYVAVVAAAAVFVAASSGDMSGLVFLYITLPWPFLGSWLFGDGGLTGGFLIGLALNAAVSFGIGYGVARAASLQR